MAVWRHKLHLSDVWKNEAMPLRERRDEIVKRIKHARFYDENDYSLTEVVERLVDLDFDDPPLHDQVEEFDFVWDEFYDWADANRVWVEIH